MIVADASLIAHLFIPGPSAADARKVYTADSEWYSVPLWKSEFTNVLLKHLRAGSLAQGDTPQLIEKALELMLDRERQVTPGAVLGLAVALHISAYDAEYVSLARNLNVPLVTFDKKLIRAAGGIAVLPADFNSQH